MEVLIVSRKMLSWEEFRKASDAFFYHRENNPRKECVFLIPVLRDINLSTTRTCDNRAYFSNIIMPIICPVLHCDLLDECLKLPNIHFEIFTENDDYCEYIDFWNSQQKQKKQAFCYKCWNFKNFGYLFKLQFHRHLRIFRQLKKLLVTMCWNISVVSGPKLITDRLECVRFI